MIKRAFFILASALSIVGCDSQDVEQHEGSGLYVDFHTTYNCNLVENSFAGRANYDLSDIISIPTPADFKMDLYSIVSGVESLTESWGSFSDFKSGSRFSPGEYRLDVSYGSIEVVGADAPYFYGTTSFELIPDDTLSVTITAEFKNSFFLVTCSDYFKEYFSEGELSLISSEGSDLKVLPLQSTSPIFVAPGTFDLVWSGKRDAGKVEIEVLSDVVVEEGTGYALTLDVDAGNSKFKVYYDDEIIVKEIELVVSDDPMVDLPVVNASGFTSAKSFDYSKSADNEDIIFNIFADGEIANCIMKFSASAMTELVCDEELSLVSLTNQSFMRLKGVEIKGLDANREKMAYVKMNGLLDNISVGEYSFSVKATDIYGRESSNCVLKINIVE